MKDHNLHNEFVGVLESVEDFVREMVDDTEDNILSVVWEWIEGLAQRVGIDRAWEVAIAFVQRMGLDQAWSWFASQTQAVKKQASVILASLDAWDIPDLDIDAGEIQKTIANVIDIEFRGALKTTREIRRSIENYLGSAGHETSKASLIV